MQFLRADNKRTPGSRALVPFADGFVCGFTCFSETRFNKNSPANRFCIQEGDTSQTTTETYQHARDWMQRSQPDFAVLENLITLAEKDSDHTLSDGEFIVKDLQSRGFAVLALDMQAVSGNSNGSRSGTCSFSARAW